MQYTENDLFDRLVKLEGDKLTLAADIKQLKEDFAYDEEENPKGILKENIKLTHAAAKLQAKNNFEETQEKAKAVFDKFKELTQYNG